MVQPEAGAGIKPVLAFGFGAAPPKRRALAPAVAFANVPGIQLQDQLVRLRGQFQLPWLGRRLLVQCGAQALRPLSLTFGFAIQRGTGQLQAREMCEHGAGILHRHYAGQ